MKGYHHVDIVVPSSSIDDEQNRAPKSESANQADAGPSDDGVSSMTRFSGDCVKVFWSKKAKFVSQDPWPVVQKPATRHGHEVYLEHGEDSSIPSDVAEDGSKVDDQGVPDEDYGAFDRGPFVVHPTNSSLANTQRTFLL